MVVLGVALGAVNIQLSACTTNITAQGPAYIPSAHPDIPLTEIILDPNLQLYIKELASGLDTNALFLDIST